MKPCISQATTLTTNFADDVANFADAGCDAMEVWLPKLETHLESQSAAVTKKLLTERNITMAAAAYQGGLLLSQGEQRKAHYDHFRTRLDLCESFEIPTLLVVADFEQRVDETSLQRAVVSLKQAAQWASAFDVRLALEFRGRNTFCASLDTAVSLIEHCEEPNVGINLDVFHYYIGPSKEEDLARLPPERLFHVQLSDSAGVPRELAQDSDRIMPGDGDFQLPYLLEHLRNIGYDGWVSLELMNQTLWQANPKQVVEIGITALRKILGLADVTSPPHSTNNN